MPNSQPTSQNSFFWSDFITEKNVDLSDLPERYRSNDGDFLKELVKQQAEEYVDGGAAMFKNDWITAKTLDGAVFAYPDVDTLFDLSNQMNYGSAKGVDAKTLGVIVSLVVYSRASFQFQSQPELSECMGQNYHALRSSFYSLLDVALYPDEIKDTGSDEAIERLKLFVDATDEQKAYLSTVSDAVYSITN